MLACDLIMEVRASRTVTTDHIARLERAIPPGTMASREIIDFLFVVDHYAERAAPGWTQLLAKAVLSGVVLGEAPMGVLSEDKADWLVRKIGSERIANMRSLELVARILARCEEAPEWLRDLLVELSARNHRPVSQRDARSLQATLAEAFPAKASAAESGPESIRRYEGRVVPMSAPVEAAPLSEAVARAA